MLAYHAVRRSGDDGGALTERAHDAKFVYGKDGIVGGRPCDLRVGCVEGQDGDGQHGLRADEQAFGRVRKLDGIDRNAHLHRDAGDDLALILRGGGDDKGGAGLKAGRAASGDADDGGILAYKRHSARFVGRNDSFGLVDVQAGRVLHKTNRLADFKGLLEKLAGFHPAMAHIYAHVVHAGFRQARRGGIRIGVAGVEAHRAVLQDFKAIGKEPLHARGPGGEGKIRVRRVPCVGFQLNIRDFHGDELPASFFREGFRGRAGKPVNGKIGASKGVGRDLRRGSGNENRVRLRRAGKGLGLNRGYAVWNGQHVRICGKRQKQHTE